MRLDKEEEKNERTISWAISKKSATSSNITFTQRASEEEEAEKLALGPQEEETRKQTQRTTLTGS